MFCLSESDTFYLYPYPTDMRKSFYSLSGIVTNEMKRDVQDGEAFIFVNRALTSMKILHAEYGGLVMVAGTGADDTGNQPSRSEAESPLAAPKVKERKDRLNPVNQSFMLDIFCTFAL